MTSENLEFLSDYKYKSLIILGTILPRYGKNEYHVYFILWVYTKHANKKLSKEQYFKLTKQKQLCHIDLIHQVRKTITELRNEQRRSIKDYIFERDIYEIVAVDKMQFVFIEFTN